MTKIRITGFPFTLEFDPRYHKIRDWGHLRKVLMAQALELAQLAATMQRVTESMDGQTQLLENSDDGVSQFDELENGLSHHWQTKKRIRGVLSKLTVHGSQTAIYRLHVIKAKAI